MGIPLYKQFLRLDSVQFVQLDFTFPSVAFVAFKSTAGLEKIIHAKMQPFFVLETFQLCETVQMLRKILSSLTVPG